MPSRLTVMKPGNAKVTEYTPGGRLTTEYWPVSLVTAARGFLIQARLEASTPTPGTTAPGASLTTPAMVPRPCAWRFTVPAKTMDITRTNPVTRVIVFSSSDGCLRGSLPRRAEGFNILDI